MTLSFTKSTRSLSARIPRRYCRKKIKKRFESCRATPRPSHFLTSLPAQDHFRRADGKSGACDDKRRFVFSVRALAAAVLSDHFTRTCIFTNRLLPGQDRNGYREHRARRNGRSTR